MPRARALAYLLPAILGVVLFLPVLGGDFVYDDLSLISENPSFQDASLYSRAWTTPYWELVDASRFSSGFYRPVGAVALGALWQLGDGSPRLFHWASLLLHGACAAAVAALALSLGWRPWAAALAGLLFAAHGSHSESVAWISALPELLATLFGLLGLCALRRNSPPLVFLAFALAMLSKEVALGIWLLALALTVLEGSGQAKRGRLVALGLSALVVYALRSFAFESAAAGFDRINTVHGLQGLEAMALSFSLIARYLGFLIWPWPHRPFRPLELDPAAFDARLWLGALGLAVALAALFFWWRRRKDLPLHWGLGLLFAGLLPVLNTAALGQYPFEERFLLLPSAGFCLLVVALLQRLPRNSWQTAAVALVLIPNAVSAHRGLAPWKEEEALFQWAREVSPQASTGHVEYGRLMLERAKSAGDEVTRAMYCSRALDAYEASLEISPDEVLVTSVEREKGNLGLGDALYLEGDFAAANQVYQRVVDHYRYSPVGYLGLANCRAQMALVQGFEGRIEYADKLMGEAVDLFDQALAQDPGLFRARSGKAAALMQLNRLEEAEVLAQELFANHPADFERAQLLCSAQLALGKAEDAILTLQRFLELAPDHAQAGTVATTIEQLRALPPAPLSR